MSNTPFYAGHAITAEAMNNALIQTCCTQGTQAVDSETATPLTGLILPVTTGVTYRLRYVVPFVGNTSGTPHAYVTLSGPATSFFANSIIYVGDGGGAYLQTAIGNNSGCESGGLTSGDYYTAQGDAIVTFSASGNVYVAVAASLNSLVFTCQAGGILDLWQPIG